VSQTAADVTAEGVRGDRGLTGHSPFACSGAVAVGDVEGWRDDDSVVRRGS
jgi:hypothetical protein